MNNITQTALKTKKGRPPKLPNDSDVTKELLSYARSLLNEKQVAALNIKYGEDIWDKDNAVEMSTLRRGINAFIKEFSDECMKIFPENDKLKNIKKLMMSDKEKIKILAVPVAPVQIREGNKVVTMYKNALYLALEDIFTATKKHLKKWVFMDQCGNIANINMSIVHAQGSDITDWDKAEAFLINATMSFKLFTAYQVKLIRKGELDGSTDTITNEEAIKHLEHIMSVFSGALKSAKNVCMTRVAKRIKDSLGELKNDDIRSQINAMEMSTYLTEVEEEIEC
jgi:hypothetical protein